MNTLHEDDEDTSTRVHNFVRRIVAYNAKHEFLAGSYCCAEDNRQPVTLHGFLGILILQFNLQIVVAQRILLPNPDLVSLEVSRICNTKHIATKMMQSFIFPPEIVQEMDAADHYANWEITPSALYTSINAAIMLMNELNGIIKAGTTRSVCVASMCVAIINMNPMPNRKVL